MKFKRMIFTFDVEGGQLTADHIGILTANFEEVKRSAVKSLRDNMAKIPNNEMRAQASIMANAMENDISWSFDKDTAQFEFPYINPMEGAMEAFGLRIQIPHIFPERKMERFILNDVTKAMGLKAWTTRCQVFEIERDITVDTQQGDSLPKEIKGYP